MIKFRQSWLLTAFLILTASTILYAGNDFGAPEIPLTFVKGGCFPMGDQFGDGGADEKPVHEVCVDGLYLGTFEVTEAQWQKVMGKLPGRESHGPEYPVTGVSWQDAREFVKKLNRLSGLNYRLPTEAEWEYAARSGGKRQKYAGATDETRLAEHAWYEVNSSGTLQPAGKKLPNGLGIYDLSGNAWEWVQDRYDSLYYRQSPRQNPSGDPFGVNRVARGGAFSSKSGQLRATYRDYVAPDVRNDNMGFRLVLPAH